MFSIYHQYHKEIKKRVAPALKIIAKKRKKQEQEELAKLTKIQEDTIIEKENDHKIETTPILPPPPITNNRISSPLSVKGNWNFFSHLKLFLFCLEENISPKEKKSKIKQPIQK